jgi:hypothetical protein
MKIFQIAPSPMKAFSIRIEDRTLKTTERHFPRFCAIRSARNAHRPPPRPARSPGVGRPAGETAAQCFTA